MSPFKKYYRQTYVNINFILYKIKQDLVVLDYIYFTNTVTEWERPCNYDVAVKEQLWKWHPGMLAIYDTLKKRNRVHVTHTCTNKWRLGLKLIHSYGHIFMWNEMLNIKIKMRLLYIQKVFTLPPARELQHERKAKSLKTTICPCNFFL